MSTFLCLNCRSPLNLQEEIQITCSHCQIIYPVLGSSIPLLLPKPTLVITHAIVHYEQIIAEYKRNIHALQQCILNHTRPAALVNTLIEAYQTNLQLFVTIKKMLEPLILFDEFTTHITGSGIARERYNFNLNYLKRDWSGTPSDEEELSQVMSFLRSMFPVGAISDGPILFLGAGLARVPVEFTRTFNEVYAVDNSLTMAALFAMIREADVSFYDIQLKNNAKTDQLAKKRTASASVCELKGETVKYVVADSLDLPFPENFFSAVISIFFTDVVPFDAQLKEIKRVTKSGGLFVHYGPLEYHHEDVSCMYSFEEIKERCESSGYEMACEDRHMGGHCSSTANGLTKVYTNWMASFRKSECPLPVIEAESVFALRSQLTMTKMISVQETGLTTEISINVPGGITFNASDFIIDMLLEIDGIKTFQQVLTSLEEMYGSIDGDSIASIRKILTSLIASGGLQQKA
jgi:carnosine N-methyltransferase